MGQSVNPFNNWLYGLTNSSNRGSNISPFFDPNAYSGLGGEQPTNVTQLTDPSFGTKGVNPRTGLPYSESPGKSATAPPDAPSDESNRTDAPVLPSGPSDSEDRVSPTGVPQAGRNLGLRLPSMDEVNAYAGREVANRFASVELPGVGDAVAMGRDPAEATAIASGDSVETTFEPGKDPVSTIIPGDASPETGDLSMDRANQAFRTADNTIDGLKGREAELGLVYASGKYWVRNPDAGQDGAPALLEVSGSEPGGANRDAVRQYKGGAIDAQQFFADYVQNVQDNPPATADTTVTSSDPLDANTDPDSTAVPGRPYQPGEGFGPTPPVPTDQSDSDGVDDEQGTNQLEIARGLPNW